MRSHNSVLDLSRILAGPWASQTLTELGANVIKVERPLVGDDIRGWGPPYVQDAAGHDTALAAYYLSANRNKQSITVDITSQEGQRLIRALAAKSDVMIENYKVGGLQQYHLDYASLRSLNPGIIYCSITGFGQTGPYASRAGYDFLIQGLGDLMSLTGRPDSQEGGGPMKVGVAVTDLLTGLYACTGILAALAHRQTTGIGQHIDLALLDVQVACLPNQASAYLTTGKAPARIGNTHPSIVPYEAFPTEDGYMILAIGNHGQFGRFCTEAKRSELAIDPRFLTNQARVENRSVLIPILRRITIERTTTDCINTLEVLAVPCGPINNLADVFADPQVRFRELQVTLNHAELGSISLVTSPIRLSETPVEYRSAPPTLGEHTHEVLSRVLGLSRDDIRILRENGTI